MKEPSRFILIICLLIFITLVIASISTSKMKSITGDSLLDKLFNSKAAKNLPPPKITNPSIIRNGVLTLDKYSKEKELVSKISNQGIKNSLNEALNYELKSNERFGKKGDIIVKLKNGREIVRLGYQAQKEFSMQKNTDKEWPELKLIKRNIPKNYEQLVRKKSPKPSLITTRGVDDLNEDGLNQLNSLFHKDDYSPDGLMYYAADLYNNGVFPFLPYLTPVKDQGYRGTCAAFALVSARELLMRDRPDISEQNTIYGAYGFRYSNKDNSSFHSNYSGLEVEWPYNPMPCISLEDDWQVHGGRGSHVFTGSNGSYYSELLDENIPCSDTDGQGIIVGDHFKPHYPIMTSTSYNSMCILTTRDDIYTLNNYNPDPENVTKYMALLINDLKYPIVIVPGWIEIDEVVDGFITEDVIDYGRGHVVSVVGFIPNDEIPERVKNHPSFVSGDNYFIVKNSLGTDLGDSGFLYFPESVLKARIPTVINGARGGISEIYIRKYNVDSKLDDCPTREFKGVAA